MSKKEMQKFILQDGFNGSGNFLAKPIQNGFSSKLNTIGLFEPLSEQSLGAVRKIGEDRRLFRKMLEMFVPAAAYSIKGNERILDLGCGKCFEAHVLSGYFGKQPFGFSSQEIQVVGIDNNRAAIEIARKEYAPYIEKNESNFLFIDADARRVGELVGGKFDIVVARKPNVAELTSVWREIFENVRDKMKEDSILIATSFTAKEHALMEEILKTAGFRIFLNEANPFARPLEIKNGIQISVDHSIIIAKLGRA